MSTQDLDISSVVASLKERYLGRYTTDVNLYDDPKVFCTATQIWTLPRSVSLQVEVFPEREKSYLSDLSYSSEKDTFHWYPPLPETTSGVLLHIYAVHEF